MVRNRLPENIKPSEKHRPVTRNIKHPAAHTSNAAILNAEPMLHKVQLQSVLPAGRNRHYVMEMSKPMPFVKTTIADVGSITSETTEAAAEDVPFPHPNIAVRVRVRKMSYDDPDRKHAMRGARQNFNRIYKCLGSGEIQMNGSVARGRHICKYVRGCNVISAGLEGQLSIRFRDLGLYCVRPVHD